MPEWIVVKGGSLYNLDHVVAVTKASNGMAVLILADESQILTDTPYDELFEWLAVRGTARW
jgi:hypothetical protein